MKSTLISVTRDHSRYYYQVSSKGDKEIQMLINSFKASNYDVWITTYQDSNNSYEI